MKRWIAMVLVLAAVLGMTAPVSAAGSFWDVPYNAYYYNAVNWAVNHSPVVTLGTSASTFSPDDYCTRAQAVTFIWRAMGCPGAVMQYCPFTDVKKDSWYYQAVMWASEKGVTSGTTATAFSPNAYCTRGQIVSFLWRAMGQPKAASTYTPFRDVRRNSYYATPVAWASNHSPVITAGTSSTTFSPEAYCTRAQIVTFLYRLDPGIRPDTAPYLTATYAFPRSDGGVYDILRVDWRCDVDAKDTYWCTMNWYDESGESGRYTGTRDGSGYAGFQNVGGKHKVIMSIWGTNRGTPTVESIQPGAYQGTFTGEGTGKQVLTDYDWQVGVWYTMQIEARQEGGKTVYYQFITPENGATEFIAAISFPRSGLGFTWACAFQEDWLYNNFPRSCYLRNAWSRNYGDVNWDPRNSYYVSNTAGKAEGTANVRYNCDFAAYGNTLWMQSGGSDFSTKCRVVLPCSIAVSG